MINMQDAMMGPELSQVRRDFGQVASDEAVTTWVRTRVLDSVSNRWFKLELQVSKGGAVLREAFLQLRSLGNVKKCIPQGEIQGGRINLAGKAHPYIQKYAHTEGKHKPGADSF